MSQAAQTWQGVKLMYGGQEVCRADILPENFDHVEEKLYIGLSSDNFSKLQKSGLSTISCARVYVRFELKNSYFNSLLNSVKRLPRDVIKQLVLDENHIPLEEFSVPQVTNLSQYTKMCSLDQFEALKAITLTSSISQPVVVIGPFGTGKTRILALASHVLFNSSSHKSRILVCTHQRVSADNFLQTFLSLKDHLPLTIFQRDVKVLLVRNYGYRSRELSDYYVESKNVKDHIPLYSPQRYHINCLIVTTCLTAPDFANTLTGFFTHIFIDEGAQMREPEAVAPLCVSDNKTRIVIAGDPLQVKYA